MENTKTENYEIGEPFTDNNGNTCRMVCGEKIVQSDDEDLNYWVNKRRVELKKEQNT